MSKLITKPAYIEAVSLKKYKMAGAARPLMKLTGVDRINEICEQLDSPDERAFVDGFFSALDIQIEFDTRELRNVPSSGAFISIANHPFGILDGMILLKLLLDRRPDYKLGGNLLLQQIDPLQNFLLKPSSPSANELSFEHPDVTNQLRDHLVQGNGLGIFPSGVVSSFRPSQGGVVDPMWDRYAIKFIRHSKVPVVPIFVQGGNSAVFQLMSMFHPSLQKLAMPKETLRKQNSSIKVRIGKPISVEDLSSVKTNSRLSRYLRARTYSLGSALKVKPFFNNEQVTVSHNHIQDIAPAVDLAHIQKEIDHLRDSGSRYVQHQGFEGFIAEATQVPNLLQEIGRQREITFRAVGEGTNQASDLDEYDLYYYHLILWDNESKKVAGSYRLGKGDEIITKYGLRGFYTHSLFKIKRKFGNIMSKAVELGRSFIAQEYQRKRMPLFLLWRGINVFLERHPDMRYLVGPVSISNSYSRLSRSFIVAYIKQFYFDNKLSKLVKPRKKFRTKFAEREVASLMEGMTPDLHKADDVISSLEPSRFKMPVLIKKYIHQNARIIAFNVDPNFNDALDGFMILDLDNLPQATLDGLSRLQ
ncbi:MAG: GNAT family N-acyltransferase [Bacteroidota bacterium]